MTISWHRNFTLSVEDIKQTNTISNIVEKVKTHLPNELAVSELSLIVTEVYNNAVDHGLLNLDSALKQADNGLEQYYELRKQRLDDLKNGQIQINVNCTPSKRLLEIEVRDSGGGFDYHNLINTPMVYEKNSGKGLYIITKIAKDVSYNSANNTLKIVYRIPAEEALPQQAVQDFSSNATNALK